MSDVLERINAALDEIEAVATAATPGPWTTVIPHEWATPLDGELLVRTAAGRDYWDALITPAGGEHGDDGLRGADAAHIALHDPAAVLRMAAGARAILDIHRPVNHGTLVPEWWCPMCATIGICPTLQALAAMFAVEPEQATEARA